jgi:hypothetical protein
VELVIDLENLTKKSSQLNIDISFTVGYNIEMLIGLIDADLLDKGTNFPNLALMKLSKYYKNLGHYVRLINYDDYNKVFIAKVFDYTKLPTKFNRSGFLYSDVTSYYYPAGCYITTPQITEVDIGGTGFFFDKAVPLPSMIEHHMPDYDLYTGTPFIEKTKNTKYYIDYSIGFTTRGCFRKCKFCVNQHYNKVLQWSPIEEFLDTNKKKICLLDDNIYGYEKYATIFENLMKTGKRFQYKQGLDFRLLTEKKADLLTASKYDGDYIFAFDNINEKDIILRKMKIWHKYWNGIKNSKFYVLCAFESQDIRDIVSLFERIKLLADNGCYSYVMRYKDYKNSKWEQLYTAIASWCNQPHLADKMTFREFAVLRGMRNNLYKQYRDENRWQEYAEKYTKGSTWRALEQIEKEYPFIKKYFNFKITKHILK